MIDVERGRGGRRHDGAHRAACEPSQFPQLGGEPVEGVPPEAVEHEQHGGPGTGDRRGHPLDGTHAEQCGHHPRHVGSRVVGFHRRDRLHRAQARRAGEARHDATTRGGGGVTRDNVGCTRAHGERERVQSEGLHPGRLRRARALLSLALHGSERPTSVKEIAERTGLPQPYLEQILLAVKGAGLVRSKRGVGGGYVLARPPTEITLADILAAVDGPLTTLMGEHDHCEGHCILQEVWVGVSDETRQILERFTLSDLVERTRIGHPAAGPMNDDDVQVAEVVES